LFQFFDNSDTDNVNASEMNVHKGKFPNFDQLNVVRPYSMGRDLLYPQRATELVVRKKPRTDRSN